MGAKLSESLAILGGLSAVLSESEEWVSPRRVSESAPQRAYSRTMAAMSLAEEKNKTSFTTCKDRPPMKATPYARHSTPEHLFAKQDKENPTYRDPGNCRAAAAGNLRMMQYNKPPRETQKRIMRDASDVPNFHAWGTGVGGVRMKTLKDGTKVRDVKHTPPYSPPGGSKGPSGNRQIMSVPFANAKPDWKKRDQMRAKDRKGNRTSQAMAKAGK